MKPLLRWRVACLALLLLADCGDGGSPDRGGSADPGDAGSGPAEQAGTAAEIAEWLLYRYGLENQIPMMRDELLGRLASRPEFTGPQRDRLIAIITGELDRRLEPKMVELCVESFTLDELRALRGGRETPDIGEAFARWARSCEEDLEPWCASLAAEAVRKLDRLDVK